MRTLFNKIKIGGLQQKIFNLVLITMLVLVGTFAGVSAYQQHEYGLAMVQLDNGDVIAVCTAVSVWLDIKLLLRTFTVLLKKESTQGFTQAPDKNILQKEEIEKNEHNALNHGSRTGVPLRR